MTTQKALWLPDVGAEFTLGTHAIPEPGPGEVLVQLEASALNPVEWKIQRSGVFMIKEYPAILGLDGAGVVRKVGDGVINLTEGDEVFFQSSFGNKYGTHQEYCLTNASLAAKIPPNISFEQAASIPTGFNPFAVATYAQPPQGLGLIPPFEEGGLGKYANQPILIMGGASSVGQYAIQLAKLSGFAPIIATASLHNTDHLVALGATHVLDRTLSASTLKDRVGVLTRGAPIPYVFDAVSLPETQRAAWGVLAPGGVLEVVAPPVATDGDSEGSTGKRVQRVFGSFHVPATRALGVRFAGALTRWLEEGVMQPNNVEVLPGGLNGVVSGLKRLAENGVSAVKLVVRPAETE